MSGSVERKLALIACAASGNSQEMTIKRRASRTVLTAGPTLLMAEQHDILENGGIGV